MDSRSEFSMARRPGPVLVANNREPGSYVVAVLGLIFVASVLNYIDRQSLSILAPMVQSELRMSDVSYGHVVMAFLATYAAGCILAGPIADRFGVRMAMALFVAWWSAAEILPTFAHSSLLLGVGRLLLGAGEAGIWVAAPKVVKRIVSPEQHGTAVGIYTAGASVGAAIAPLLAAGVTARFGWRMVFLATGVAGLMWVLPWLVLYRTPEQRPIATAEGGRRWGRLLLSRPLLLLLLARALTDPVWYFYLFWFPKYLSAERHVTLAASGHVLWVVYVMADIGGIFGGWVASRWMRRGGLPAEARRNVMTVAAIVMPLGCFLPMLSVGGAIAVGSLVVFAHMAWLVSLTALVIELFSQSELGSAFGLIAAGSSLGGMLSTYFISHSVQTHGYVASFVVLGCVHPLALLLLWSVRLRRDDFSAQVVSEVA